MANRRSFASTERPQGAGLPTHKSTALDALSGLAKRGSQVRKPMPKGSVKQPSPVVLETLNRLGQRGQMQQQAQMPPQMPQQQAPQQQMAQPMAQPMQQQMTQPQMEQPMQQEEFQMPPVEGYWGQVLEKTIADNPKLKKEWQPAVDKFKQIRASLDIVRDYVRELHRNSAVV